MQIINAVILKDTMYYGTIPVFTYQIIYPSFHTTCSAQSAQKINEYYAKTARNIEHYCRTVLYPQAVKSAQYIPVNVPAFNGYTFDSKYTITYNNQCITSLYIDSYTYMGGAHGETHRTSDTWNFETGAKLQLEDMGLPTSAALSRIQSSIEGQIMKRLAENPGSYFDDYRNLIGKTFNPKSFYIEPGTIVFYFQQYDIAPYSTGLPEFYVPINLG